MHSYARTNLELRENYLEEKAILDKNIDKASSSDNQEVKYSNDSHSKS